jgi:hypothetical protein
MKRLAVFLVALFTLVSSLFAAPIYPVIKTKLPLATGRTLELDFSAPKDALQYFDNSILTDGLSKLLADNKLDADVTVIFVPRNIKGAISFLVSFDDMNPAKADALKPVKNDYDLRCLPLGIPRDALRIALSWYNSFLVNKSPDKSADFLAPDQVIAFTVNYTFSGQSTQLILGGTFLINNIMFGVPMSNRAIFDPIITISDLKTFTSNRIRLYSQANLPYLQNAYMFMLDPIEDPKNPGIAMPSALVYPLFGMKP